MKLISEYIGQNLEIVTPRFFKTENNLVANGITLCTLKSTNFWCTRYEIIGFGNIWEVYSLSVWQGTTAIREKGKEIPLASYECSGLRHSGYFWLPQGIKAKLVFNLWKSFFELQTESGEVLVHYKSKGFFNPTIVVTIKHKNELLDKYPFLLMMPFFIAQQRSRSAATIAH